LLLSARLYRELQSPQGSLRQVLKFRPQRSQKWLGGVLRSQEQFEMSAAERNPRRA